MTVMYINRNFMRAAGILQTVRCQHQNILRPESVAGSHSHLVINFNIGVFNFFF